MKQLSIPIGRINIKSKFVRNLRVHLCKDLIRSIKAVGLIHPLIVDTDFNLLSGGRRLTALKSLGWKEVPCLVYEKAEMQQEILTIDENIVRKDFVGVELEEVLAKRKRLYQAMYPETKRGYNNSTGTHSEKKKFSQEMADKTAISVASIDAMIRRAELNSDNVKQARMDGDLTSRHATVLCKLTKEDQDKILDRIKHVPAAHLGSIIRDIQSRGVEEVIEDDSHLEIYRKMFNLIDRSSGTLERQLRKALREEILFSGDQWPEIHTRLFRLQKHLKHFLDNHKQVRSV